MDTAPRNVHTLSLDARFNEQFSAVLDLFYVGEYFLDAGNTATYPGHEVVNLRFAWTPRENLRASLRVDNVFDTAYADRADFAFGDYRYFPARAARAVPLIRLYGSITEGPRMIPAYVVSVLISLGMIAHCIRNGRNRIWVYVLVILMTTPFIGAALYATIEILPDLLGTRTSRRAMRGIRQTLDPEGDLRRAQNEVMVSGNVAARQQYADELVRLGRADEAVTIYQNCLTGVFANDPKLLLGYAHAQFAANNPAGARGTLDELIAKNPDFKSPDGHLLYARALEGEGNVEKALAEFATLAGYYPGAEASVRYAKLLKRSGQEKLAGETLQALLERAKYAPAHYRQGSAGVAR